MSPQCASSSRARSAAASRFSDAADAHHADAHAPRDDRPLRGMVDELREGTQARTARASRWGSCSHTALPWRGVRARTALASHMSTLRRARLALSQQVSGCRSLRRGHERAVISPRSSLTKDARPCGHGRVTSLAHAVRVGLRSYDYNPSDAHRLAVRAASAEARDTDKARALCDRSRGPIGMAQSMA